MYKKSYIFFLWLFAACNIFGQSSQKTMPDAEMLISTLYRTQQGEDLNYADFYESLYQFYLNPLDLNSADPEELRSVYILNDIQIAAILKHIKIYGPFASVYELQSIPDFSSELIRNLMPFVTIRSLDDTWRGLNKQLVKPDQHYLLLRSNVDIEKAKGYKTIGGKPPAYPGNSQNYYFRYRFQKYKSYSFGITAENDAGEILAFDPKNKKFGTDFLSFHAMVFNKGKIKKLILGDYQLQFGQGLLLSGGFFTGKGSETILSVRRSSTGIRPYTSLLETSYLRGVAATIALGPIEITPFVSQKFIDGSISDDTIQERDNATIHYTGLHRTTTELASRASVREQMTGLNTHYLSLNKNFQAGMNFVNVDYDKVLQVSPRFYNKYEFNGNRNYNASAYYSYFFRNISFFGEAGMSKGDGRGGIQGLMLSLGPKVDLAVVYRNYNKSLHTPYGNSFGENYKNSNEEGVYWGIKIRLNAKTEFTGYYDIYKFPWLKYQVSAPSFGKEYLVSVRHKFNKKTLLLSQFRKEIKEKDTETTLSEKYLTTFTRSNYSVILELKSDRNIVLKSRVQGSKYQISKKSTYGYYISQDLGYEGQKFDISFRMALFDTDDFNTRQYAYENDVLYSFSIPFFSGSGMRNYIVSRINLTKNIGLWLKYSRTQYFDKKVNGSGNEEVNGNIRSDIKAELRYLFN